MGTPMTKVRSGYCSRFRKNGRLLCGLCGYYITDESEITVDHIIPKSRGGANNVMNFQPAHLTCNANKSNNLPEPWFQKEENEYQGYQRKGAVGDTYRGTRSHGSGHSNAISDIARNPKFYTRTGSGKRKTGKRDYHYRKSAASRRNLAADYSGN